MKRIYWWLLSKFCPRFYEDMPSDQAGKFFACAIRTNPFNSGREFFAEEVSGLVPAYVKAREKALWLDWFSPYANGEIGVDWAIKPKEAGQ